MASPDSSDRSLLDRLNALKPTTISLDTKSTQSTATGAPASTDARPTSVEKKDQPILSREDALAERLRVLRNNSQPDTNKPSNSNLPRQSSSSLGGTLAQPQCPATQLKDDIPNQQPLSKSSSSSPVESQKTEKSKINRSFYEPENAGTNEEDDDYIHLLESGVDPDQTLDELLNGLDEDFDLDDTGPPSLGFDPAKEAKKVSDLLEQFQKENSTHSGGSGVPAKKSHDGHAGNVFGEQAPRRGGPDDNGDDDDSESEHMTREVDDIIARLRDELGVGLEEKQEAGETGGGTAAPAASTSQEHSEEVKSASNSPGAAAVTGSPSLSLPDAPASPLRDLNPPTQEPQVGEGERRKSTDFETDIVTRMASLKGITMKVDEFGLPVAPTFSPETHQSPKNKKVTKGVGRAGYTDEDQKTWCIVCLDDATIKCIGCDSDVYCGRCWRDMHVGPRAGYDERGHQWVKFVRGG